MLIYENRNHFHGLKVNIRLINESIVKVQKKIYFFTKEQNISQVYIYQRKLLQLKKEVLLVVLFRLINEIKKKDLNQRFIIKNF